MSPEERQRLRAIKADFKSLDAKYRVARENNDPCAAERGRKEIGRCHARLAVLKAAPGDPLDWWCVFCERVSVQPKPLPGTPRCRYPDCHPGRRAVELFTPASGLLKIGGGFMFTPGCSWFVIRRDLHPEYPEAAEHGRRYPVPEIKPDIKPIPPKQA